MPLAYGLVQPVDLHLPRLPQSLNGLRIAHLTDLHARYLTRRHHTLINQLTAMRLDMLALTGDYMSNPGDEDAALDVLRRILDRIRPPLGVFGVFGNHDTDEFVQRAAYLPVTWLRNTAVRLDDRPIEVLGLSMQRHQATDAAAVALDLGRLPAAGSGRSLRLLLGHRPNDLPTAADLDADLMLAGHTHGGQIRLPAGKPLKNSSDLPLDFTTGLLQCGPTTAAVSRGLGEVTLPFRLFCPPHAPVYTLRQRPSTRPQTPDIQRLQAW